MLKQQILGFRYIIRSCRFLCISHGAALTSIAAVTEVPLSSIAISGVILSTARTLPW